MNDWPTPPGFRLLRTLGRGGMGVVFAAEQAELKRRVALKFLRGGDPELVSRLRAEAEAAARLAHPHIVQVHEFGSWAGRPYLVLEYVAGGSLAERLAGAPLPGRPAAGLVATLAEAVQYAHAHGVVHRDLKPANVLLSIADDQTTAFGHPKITDFGLARLLDADSELTRTGAIIGTPAYMAPEQAASRKDVGPPADTYALGAILYECLTGRPPLKAATALETLDLVRNTEPVPPRRLNPGVPRDLETICLKCLQKGPAQRYESAAALADDLRRFLAGQLIAARPVWLGERAWRWARRNPTLTALIVVIILCLLGGVAGILVANVKLRRAFQEKSAQEAAARQAKADAAANYRDARAAVEQMFHRLQDRGAANLPRLHELQMRQAEDALAFFERVIQRQAADDDPEVRADLAAALLQAAELQHALGRPGPAGDAARRALTIYRDLATEFPSQAARYRVGEATAQNTLGFLAPNLTESRRCHAEALRLREELAAAPGAGPGERAALAESLHNLGGCDWFLHVPGPAAQNTRRAIAILTELTASADAPRTWRSLLADSLANLSLIAQNANWPEELQSAHDRAEMVFAQLLRDDPTDYEALISLAQLRINWSYVLRARGQRSEALANLAQSVAPLQELLRLEPQHVRGRGMLFRLLGMRTKLLEERQAYAEAAREWEATLAFLEPNERLVHRGHLAQDWALAGDHAKAVAEVAALAKTPTYRNDPGRLFQLARVLSLAASAVYVDAKLPAANRGAALGRHADRAIGLLNRVRWLDAPAAWTKRAKEVRSAPAWFAVRLRPGYAGLLAPVPWIGWW